MRYPLLIEPEAELELEQAVNWYYERGSLAFHNGSSNFRKKHKTPLKPQPQIISRIPKADIADHRAEQRIIVGDCPAFDVGPKQIA